MERFITLVLAAAKKVHARFLAVTVLPVDGEPLGVAVAESLAVALGLAAVVGAEIGRAHV